MIYTSICALCVLIAFLLQLVIHSMVASLEHENIAMQWDKEGGYAHVSMYLSETEKIGLKESLETTEFQILSWYYGIESKLTEASITTDESSNARLYLQAYSATGEITASTEHGTVTAKAYGVGGDFFQFHPLDLIEGVYFSESDLMQDKVIIDVDIAWQLFGSNDVVGQFVSIGDIPHLVVGVYEKEEGYFQEHAGNEELTMFVSHASLYDYGVYYGLETVEYLLPNPVSGFAYQMIADLVGEEDIALVEHQNRFEPAQLVESLQQLPIRSMGLSGVTFPYWENVARAYQDIIAILFSIQMLMLAIAAVILIVWIWKLWIRRKWRVSGVYAQAKDTWYKRAVERKRRKEEKREGKKEIEA